MENRGYVGGYGEEMLILSGQTKLANIIKNTDTDKTIAGMQEWVRRYYGDLSDYADWTLEDFYDLVKNLPYKMEEREWGQQIIMRPRDILTRLVPVVACANKAILISSFLTMHGIKNGFVVSANSQNENFGHVFNWLQFPNSGTNSGTKSFVDATYPENVIFREKTYPKRKIYE
jgi:hypothetical protein